MLPCGDILLIPFQQFDALCKAEMAFFISRCILNVSTLCIIQFNLSFLGFFILDFKKKKHRICLENSDLRQTFPILLGNSQGRCSFTIPHWYTFPHLKSDWTVLMKNLITSNFSFEKLFQVLNQSPDLKHNLTRKLVPSFMQCFRDNVLFPFCNIKHSGVPKLKNSGT